MNDKAKVRGYLQMCDEINQLMMLGFEEGEAVEALVKAAYLGLDIDALRQHILASPDMKPAILEQVMILDASEAIWA